MTFRLNSTELRGEGLLLRPWDPSSDTDVPAYLRGVSDPDFRLFNNPLRHVDDLDAARLALRERARQWEAGTEGGFCVTDADDGTVLGHVSLKSLYWPCRSAGVGYWVLPEARGHGVATRALTLVADWAFSLGLHRLALDHALTNAASCRVAERCGFTYEGTLRDAHRHADGTYQDAHLHGRVRAEG
ncbi:GNAT family protein [Streptomyces sp. LHD-70]|uniref:GNAT family N-acetyltransferase n=1 Tax=Streptomyces sp. LHD-70 TaxID=3072140 RepID=UPI0028104FC4|nr:GNAT family protein [Streptomyces sp. LHD-70]MDQ8704602.1 GNAT family protein [Streptomyces sp. LHD-70]